MRRQIDIGQVRLQLVTGLGVGLKQLTVHNPPGWLYPHFVKAGTISVKVVFLPLLQRKIEVSKIILSDGEGASPTALHRPGTVTQPQIALNEAYLLELTRKSLRGKVGSQIGTELQNLLQKPLLGKPGGHNPAKPEEEEKARAQEWLEHTLRGLFKR